MKKIVNYRDLDLNFNRHPLTNDVTQLTDSESIKRALKNLLSLKRYEKPFHSEINSGIRDSLFENVSSIHLDAIKSSVFQLVQKYEPRVKLNDIVLLPNLDSNGYDITLMYTILNTQTPMNFKFVLTRSR